MRDTAKLISDLRYWQEQRIAELEAENRDILQNSVSHTTHAEFVSDYQEQLDEKDAKIAELNDFQNSQCAKLLVRNGELERELEWKDKVIELAQRKQDEAERERDALISSIERLRTKKIELCSICEFEDLIACCHKNHCDGYQLFKRRGLPQDGDKDE